MRRKYFGWAIAAIATLGPMQAWGGDREIAEQIIKRLKTHRESGALKDFTLDMKVDKGVVLFRGSVSEPAQRLLVLDSAKGIDGIAKVVDEVALKEAVAASAPATASEQPAAEAKVIKPKAMVAASSTPAKPAPAASAVAPAAKPNVAAKDGFSFREALARQAEAIRAEQPPVVEAAPVVAAAPVKKNDAGFPGVIPGEIMPTAATELASPQTNVAAAPMADDQQVTRAVVAALGDAQKNGQLRGFGVDVKSRGGVVEMTGRAASDAQRDAILSIASNVPGVVGIREAIQVPAATAPLQAAPNQMATVQTASAPLARLPEPIVDPAPYENAAPQQPYFQQASAPMGAPMMTAPYRGQAGQPTQAMNASMGMPMMGAPVSGQPVPMAPYGGGGAAPRYDSPYLPNYAWPGYAAYPNYAAVTYPQQYSPSAWPYIGPFYPYPQVPLGWRKVSLEWDDGWWFLDFTDR